MENRLRFELADLAHAIANLKMAFPELAEDEDLMADVLEGETDLHTIVGKLVDQAREQRAMQDAVNGMIESLKSRQGVWKMREAATRDLLMRILRMSGQRKITLPQATVSIAAARKTVVVIDESVLPDTAFIVRREVSKTKLKALLEEGEVAGATFSNGGETLTIR